MNQSYKLKNKLSVFIFIVGCGVLFFSAMIFFGSYASSQTNPSLSASGIRLEPELNQSEGLRKLGEPISGQPAERDRIIDGLEQRERSLRIEKETLIQEISLVGKLTENALAAASGDQLGRITIDKVKRVGGGRSGEKDMMVGVVELRAVWKQMDYILDKLDEITELLSQQR